MRIAHPSADALLALVKIGTKVVPADRCRIFFEAKQAYLFLHPQTGRGQLRVRGQKRPGPPAFASYAAGITGYSVRGVTDDIAIWTRLSANARQWLAVPGIRHNRRQLQWLADLNADQQEHALTACISGGAADLGAGLRLAGRGLETGVSEARAVSLAHVPTHEIAAELRRRGLQIVGDEDG